MASHENAKLPASNLDCMHGQEERKDHSSPDSDLRKQKETSQRNELEVWKEEDQRWGDRSVGKAVALQARRQT